MYLAINRQEIKQFYILGGNKIDMDTSVTNITQRRWEKQVWSNIHLTDLRGDC